MSWDEFFDFIIAIANVLLVIKAYSGNDKHNHKK